ncbi:CFI-box-CTERM domain-containing protein [Flavobacterium sp.]|jgi:hypothetical protein|uniref:CFI-box-CTERM domain-containing protein n=1 Tax=Flavobacterium sp. TaxID=239 RepID=UPI002622D3C1|nr:CFI-box-CTERM domain-containing protein [Flavobacterium sp.]
MGKCIWCSREYASYDRYRTNAAKNFGSFCSIRCEATAKSHGVEGKKGCFIATAVFDDYNHPVVFDLRQFRDNWLEKRSWGVKFISKYYLYSPKLANIIADNLTLKKFTMFFLIKPLHFIVIKLKLDKKN